MTESTINILTLALGIIGSLVLGIAVHRAGLCLVRAVSETRSGNPTRLFALIIIGLWIYLYLLTAHPDQQLLFTYNLTWQIVLGGVLFGVGAGLNGGCTVATMAKLFSGTGAMLFTVVGWLVGSLVLNALYQVPAPVNLTSFSISQSSEMAIVLALIALCVLVKFKFPASWQHWKVTTIIGLGACAIFIADTAWDPSGYTIDSTLAILGKGEFPTLRRTLLLLSLGLGVFISAIINKKFALGWVNRKQAINHFAAGSTMGIGLNLALGGNDTALMIRLPTFSVAAIATLIAIIVGIWITLTVREKFRKLYT